MMIAIITSYFPLYFQYRGYTTIQIGLLYSVGPLVGIVANLFWSMMSDKYRTIRKVLILIVIGQLAISLLVFRTDAFALTIA